MGPSTVVDSSAESAGGGWWRAAKFAAGGWVGVEPVSLQSEVKKTAKGGGDDRWMLSGEGNDKSWPTLNRDPDMALGICAQPELTFGLWRRCWTATLAGPHPLVVVVQHFPSSPCVSVLHGGYLQMGIIS